MSNRTRTEHQGALLPRWQFSIRPDRHEAWVGFRVTRLNMKAKGWEDNPWSVRICVIPCLPIKISRVLHNERYPFRRWA